MGISNFKRFYNSIIYERRNPDGKDSIFDDLDNKDTNLNIELCPSCKLYRARIVKDIDKIGLEPCFYGYSRKNSLTPPREKAIAHRANYQCIPYLYCSSSVETAISEVRPNENDIVSVATIIPTSTIDIIDFSCEKSESLKGTKKTLFKNLYDWFSKPASQEDNPIEYIPTQYITEYIRFNLNYGGIKYKSSLAAGDNYVLFIDDTYYCSCSELFEFKDKKWLKKDESKDDENIQSQTSDNS
ncbi:MAG: RES family NAD+ phosphorylase [Clostridia bacterium]|nr:RES family NAD+ phosphorylase [Clostridia bacterium]